MQKIFPRKFQTHWRSVLLLAVFAGLLFSGGEGIRLFPFSLAQTAEKFTSGLQTSQGYSYQKNLPRFQNNQVKSQTKIPRDDSPDRHRHWLNVWNDFDGRAFLYALWKHNPGFSTDPQIFKSSPAVGLAGSRAPPPPFS